MSKQNHILSLIFLLGVLFYRPVSAQSIMLNEVSNGTGTAEYIELVVTGPVHCDSPPDSIDIRHWIIDDNNGYFTGSGIAPGVCRFSNDDFWKNIPTGTLIVIYRGTNKNSDIPADDYSMSDGNCTLILPISSNLFERNDNQPNNTDSSYPTGGWVSGGDWDAVAMSNSNDSFQIRDPNSMSSPLHAVSYGNNNANNIIYFGGSGGSTVFYFDNTVDDNPFNQNSWTSGSTTANNNDNGPYENGSNDQTPGFANSVNNENWLITLNHNCTLPPTVYAGEDDTVCGTSTTLTATGGGSSAIYTWDNGLGNGASQTVSPSVTTQYIVTMTENGWCVNDTVMVVVGNGVSFTLNSSNPTSCGGSEGSITISGLTANTSYQVTYDDGSTQGPNSLISNASGEIIISGLSAGNYTNFVVDASGCPSTDNTIITLTDPNGPSIDAGIDQTVCNGDNVTLTATNPDGATLNWSGGITDGTAFTPSLGSTIYTVSATQNGCTSTDNVNITVNPLPNIDAGANQTICNGDNVTLTAINPDGATINWSGGITDGTPFTPSLGTTTYTVTASLNTCTSTDNVDVIVNPTPSFTLNSSNPTSCGGNDGSFTISGLNNNTSYQVSYDNGVTQGPNSLTSNASGEIIITGLSAGTYSNITVELSGCSTVSPNTINLTDPNGPSIDAGIDQTVCQGESTILTATNPDGATLNWSGGITDGTPFTPSLGSTIYTVSATQNGCTSTDNVNVTVNPLPNIDAGTDQTVCNGDNVTLTAINPDGATLNWSGGITDGTPFTPSLGTTTYTVTANLNTCISTDNVNITVNPLPTINAGADQTVCNGETVTLTANNPNGATINWSGGITDGTPFTPSLGTTIYTVSATANTCTSTDDVDITVNPLPSFNLIPHNPITCGGSDGFIEIINLSPNTNYQISYNDGSVQGPNTSMTDATGTITLNNLQSGVYTNFKVEINTCYTQDNTIINLTDPNPPAINAGPDQNICQGESAILTANNPDGANISWNNGVSDGLAFTPSLGTTSYTVTAELNNCLASDQVNITVNPVTPVNAGNDVTICLGESTTLIATGGDASGSYSWSSGQNSSTIQVSPNANTTYFVTLTQNGCSDIDQVTVNINPVASATLGNDRAICIGDQTTLSVSTSGTNLSYVWNNGATSSNQVVSPTSNTSYSVTVSDGTCSSSDEIQITVNPLPTPIITGNLNYCQGDSTELSLSENYISYLWSNSSYQPTLEVSQDGLYSVTVTDQNNCRNSTQVDVNAYINPNLEVQANTLDGCAPLIVNFNTTSSCNDCKFDWWFESTKSSSDKSPTYTFINTGTYYPKLTMTTGQGCIVNSELEIKVYPVPDANFAASPPVVDILNPEIQFNNYSEIDPSDALFYKWDFGDGTLSNNLSPMHQYSAIGQYWVDLLVESSHGCVDSVSRQITINDFFQVYFPNAFTPESGVGGNAYFYPKGIGASPDNFQMTIYDRWGEPIFESTEFPKGFSTKEIVEGGWNGRYQNTGAFVQNGLYVYRVRIMDNFKVVREYTGTVTVIR